MSDLAFEPFPKMARLTRECVITEKIDGTNAQVNIVPVSSEFDGAQAIAVRYLGEGSYEAMFAGSRTRYITPEADNMGFATWVKANADQLWALGPGRHFGEWWGSKIQRGYGRTYKTFSLFNTSRWHEQGTSPRLFATGDPRQAPKATTEAPACCSVVPELYRGLFSERIVENMLLKLKHGGSVAAPGYTQPEGIVIYHTAAGTMFKKLIEHDELPKSAVKEAA